ncbi:neutral zinc metallopeptidase [Kribbella sp. NPDC002412]
MMRIVWLLLAVLVAGCTGTTSINQSAMDADIEDAVRVVDSFWQQAFPETFGEPYESPQVAGGYTGADGPRCAGEESVPYNAYYCPAGDFIAWDEDLMAAGYSQIGDAWVYLIIAHEWAHAIQARLDADQVSVAAELQADCLAGASLQGAASTGAIAIEPGDAQELAQTLAAVADDYPWTKVSDHGNIQERTSAFSVGVNRGIEACVR